MTKSSCQMTRIRTDDEVVVINTVSTKHKSRSDKRKADRNSQINKHTCPRGHVLSQGTADVSGGSCCQCDECGKRIRVAYAISCSLCAYDMCLQCIIGKPKKVRGEVPAVKGLAAKGPAAKGPAGAAGKDGAVGKQGASGKDGAAGEDGTPGKDARNNDGTLGKDSQAAVERLLEINTKHLMLRLPSHSVPAPAPVAYPASPAPELSMTHLTY